MVRKRLIVSLLWRNGTIVQSVEFRHTNVVGDPKVAIEFFNAWDADEIVLLNVSREDTDRERFRATLRHVSEHCFLPLTVGGWVTTLDHAADLVENGADKLVINTAAIRQPGFVSEVAEKFGNQCVVVSVDVRGTLETGYEVYVNRGREPTGIGPEAAAKDAVRQGAGEILLTSIDRDGSLRGYDIPLVTKISSVVDVPVIAFGGVGKWDHLRDGLNAGADAAAAGNIYHFTEQSTRAAKNFLRAADMPVR